jgi:hypothetical protein
MNTTEAVPCPLDGRRSIAELWCKTVAVHFTTTAIFCHLLSIRRQSVFSWKLVFYVLAPWLIFIQNGLALIFILFTPLVNNFLPPARRANPWRALCWLFGSLPLPPGSPVSSPQSLSVSCTNLGRALVAAGILVQCSFTIYLYSRRRSFDPEAVTKADRKVFELGCAGLFVGTLWIAQVLGIQPFAGLVPPSIEHRRLEPNPENLEGPAIQASRNDIELLEGHGNPQPGTNSSIHPIDDAADGHEPPPEQPPEHTDTENQPLFESVNILTRLDDLMFFFRDIAFVDPPSSSARKWYTPLISYFTPFSTTSWLRHILVLGVLALMTRQIDLVPLLNLDSVLVFLQVGAYSGGSILFLVAIGATVDWSNQHQGHGYQRVPQGLQPAQGQKKSWLWHFGMHLFAWVVLLSRYILAGGIFVAGLAAWFLCMYAFVDTFLQIQRLADWPTDQACPMLWSDPNANWVWAVA